MSRRKRQRRRRPADAYSAERAEFEALDLELTVPEDAEEAAVKPLLATLLAAQKGGNAEEIEEAGEALAEIGVTVAEAETEPDVDDTPALDFTPEPGVPQPDGPGQGVQEAGHSAVEEDFPLDDDPGPEPGEEDFEDERDLLPLQPPPPEPEALSVFTMGPLAAGIQMLDAMLEQAKGGYITERVEQLEEVLHEEFDADERLLIADYASRFRDGMGLPDVQGAYEQLVVRRAELAKEGDRGD